MVAVKRDQVAFRAIVGTDESEVKRVAREVSVAMLPEGAGEMGCDVIDGAAENAEQAVQRIHETIDALLTLPFFGGGKLVWLKSANFLGDSVTGRAASVLEAVEKLTETLSAGLPPDVRFLLSATEIDKRRAFYKFLGKQAEVEVFDRIDSSRSGWEEAAAGQVAHRAKELGLAFRPDALELFTLLTGGDSRQIANELEKLDLYLGPERREVSLDEVYLMTPASRAGVIFELGNALVARNLNQALGLMEQLLFHGEKAVTILLVAIIPSVRNLLVVKDLMQRYRLQAPRAPFHFTGVLNRLPAGATAHLPRKKDGGINAYALGIAATGAGRFDLPELEAAMRACLEANVTLVTSGLEPKILLSELLVRILRPKEARF